MNRFWRWYDRYSSAGVAMRQTALLIDIRERLIRIERELTIIAKAQP